MIKNIFHSNPFQRKKVTRLFYSDHLRNFGDILSLYIFSHYTRGRYKVKKGKTAKDCDAVCIGSLLDDFLSRERQKIKCGKQRGELAIVGSGFIKAPESKQYLTRDVSVKGVRGEISLGRLKDLLGRELIDVTLGDPGLLAARCIDVSNVPKKYKVGFIRHYVDEGYDPTQLEIENILIIDIKNDVELVMAQIASCEFILSSAMHGLIAADSLGIPNRRVIISDGVIGGDYKFDDYYSIYKNSPKPAIDLRKTAIAHHDIDALVQEYSISKIEVDEIQNKLELMFESI